MQYYEWTFYNHESSGENLFKKNSRHDDIW